MPLQRSQKLIECLVRLELPDQKTDAKMDLMQLTNDLMPAGNPTFLEVVQFPKITDLEKQHGRKQMLKIIFLLVKDFCDSVNVVRNMNEDQMIEAANMLLDECGNFRLEDYLMMFSMAKKGKLAKLMDRVDMQTVTAIADTYFEQRQNEARKVQEEEERYLNSLGDTERSNQPDPLSEHFANMAGRISDLRENLKYQKEVNKANRL